MAEPCESLLGPQGLMLKVEYERPHRSTPPFTTLDNRRHLCLQCRESQDACPSHQSDQSLDLVQLRGLF